MQCGRKTGTVFADSSAQASRPERLAEVSMPVADLEVFALSGNSGTIWVGPSGTNATPDNEAGVPLAAGDSYRFGSVDLHDIFLAVDTDGDGLTWITR